TTLKSITCSAGGVIVAGSCGKVFVDVSPLSRASPAAADGRSCEWQELHPAVRMKTPLCFSSSAREFLTASGMDRWLTLTDVTMAVGPEVGGGGPAPRNLSPSGWPRFGARAPGG